MAAPAPIARRMRFWCQSFAYIGRNSDKAKADFQEAAEKLEVAEKALDLAERTIYRLNQARPFDDDEALAAHAGVAAARAALLEQKS